MTPAARNAPSCEEPSRSKYGRGCRCDGCREANRVYVAKLRLSQGRVPLGPRVVRKHVDPPKGSSFKRELSETFVHTSTREQYLRDREAPPIHFLGAA